MDDTDTPEQVVQGQLDAYNARDIDAFMAFWAADCRYHEFPSRLLAEGHDAVRQRHVERFEEPCLHGRLLERVSGAGLVVDREVVTRTFPDGERGPKVGEAEVVAIYEVVGGRIAKAWFRTGEPRLFVPDDVLLRPASKRDVDAVRDLTLAAYAEWVPVIGREPRPMRFDHAALIAQGHVTLLFAGGVLAGLIEMVPEPGALLIENVAVHPDARGRGLSRQLLAHAEEVAAKLGLPTLRLYTNKAFTRNVELYRRAGYAVDREEPFVNGTAVFMSKPTAPMTRPAGASTRPDGS